MAEDRNVAKCPSCGKPGQRSFHTQGYVAGRRSPAREGSLPSLEPHYGVVMRNCSAVESGGAGLVSNGVSVDCEGGYFAQNAEGNVRISGAARTRLVDNTFDA